MTTLLRMFIFVLGYTGAVRKKERKKERKMSLGLATKLVSVNLLRHFDIAFV